MDLEQMLMKIDWVNMTSSLFVGGGAGYLVLKFLGESTVKHSFNKNIEKYRNELSNKTEQLKTQLTIYSNQHQTSYKRIDTQKADAIKEVYGCIAKWKIEAEKFVGDLPITEICIGPDFSQVAEHFKYFNSIAESLREISKSLDETVVRNAIYLEEETYAQVIKANQKFSKILTNYFNQVDLATAGIVDHDEIVKDVEKERLSIVQNYKDEISPLYEKITLKFRSLLMDQSSSNNHF